MKTIIDIEDYILYVEHEISKAKQLRKRQWSSGLVRFSTNQMIQAFKNYFHDRGYSVSTARENANCNICIQWFE